MHITAQTISYLAFFILGRTHTALMVFHIKTFPIFQDLSQMLLISKALLSAFCPSFISSLHFSSLELPSSWTRSAHMTVCFTMLLLSICFINKILSNAVNKHFAILD